MGTERTKKKKKVSSLLWRLLKRYLENSSIHGVRYLVEDGRHWTERLFWLISCGVSWLGCAVMISGTIDEFQTRRVAVTIETDYLTWPSAFPSIHLCSLITPEVPKYISETWGRKASLARLLNERTYGYHSSLPEPHDAETFEGLANALKLNCSALFIWCDWNGKKIDCCEVFRPLVTPSGHCLTANTIFTRRSSDVNNDWDSKIFQRGSSGNGVLTFELDKQSKYWNIIAKHLTLYLLDDVEIPSALTGAEKKFSAKWKSTTYTDIDIVQKPTYNEDGIRDVPVDKRNCRFYDENEDLRIYPYYSYDVCVIESRLNVMYDRCDCLSHMSPRGSRMSVCNQTQLKCISDSLDIINEMVMDAGCVADCEETIFTFFENYYNDTAPTYSQIRVNLMPGPTSRYLRYVMRSKLDVVVSVGSALGLFVGASILSLVEIPYWFVVRAIDDKDEVDEHHPQDNQQKY